MPGNRSGAAAHSNRAPKTQAPSFELVSAAESAASPLPVSFFDRSLGGLLTFLSFAIPLLIVLAYIFTGPKVSDAAYHGTRVFLGLAFLNTSHIVLTALLMYCLPEFRSYLGEKGRPFFTVLGVVLFCSVPLLSLRGSVWNGFAFDLLLLRPLVFATTIHHSMFQTHGLYRQRHRAVADLPGFANGYKYWLYAMIAISLVGYYGLGFKNFFLMKSAAAVAVAVWLAGTYVAVSKADRANRMDVLQFMNRQLCMVLCYLSPLITLLAMVFHGLEYLQVSRSMIQKSRVEENRIRLFWIGFWLWMPVCFMVNHAAFYLPFTTFETGFRQSAIFYFSVAATTMSFLHYTADRLLFRFSDSSVRNHIGPLFK